MLSIMVIGKTVNFVQLFHWLNMIMHKQFWPKRSQVCDLHLFDSSLLIFSMILQAGHAGHQVWHYDSLAKIMIIYKDKLLFLVFVLFILFYSRDYI